MTNLSPDTRLMATVNRWVEANRQPGNSFSGQLAAIRAGITPAGASLAIAHAAPGLNGLTDRQQAAAVRAAAIRAINKDVGHTDSGTIGSALHLLQSREGSDSIDAQVAALPLMNADAAALVLDGLVGRCAQHQIPVNFFSLATTLVHWGHGGGSRSSSRRNQLVLDYYGASVARSFR